MSLRKTAKYISFLQPNQKKQHFQRVFTLHFCCVFSTTHRVFWNAFGATKSPNATNSCQQARDAEGVIFRWHCNRDISDGGTFGNLRRPEIPGHGERWELSWEKINRWDGKMGFSLFSGHLLSWVSWMLVCIFRSEDSIYGCFQKSGYPKMDGL